MLFRDLPRIFWKYHVPFYKNWEHEKDWEEKKPYANSCQTNVEFLKYRLTAVIDFPPQQHTGDTILGKDINHIQEANTSSGSLSVKDISSFRLRWKSAMQGHCPIFFMGVRLDLLLLYDFQQSNCLAMFHIRWQTVSKCKDLGSSGSSGVDNSIIKNQFHQAGPSCRKWITKHPSSWAGAVYCGEWHSCFLYTNTLQVVSFGSQFPRENFHHLMHIHNLLGVLTCFRDSKTSKRSV